VEVSPPPALISSVGHWKPLNNNPYVPPPRPPRHFLPAAGRDTHNEIILESKTA